MVELSNQIKILPILAAYNFVLESLDSLNAVYEGDFYKVQTAHWGLSGNVKAEVLEK